MPINFPEILCCQIIWCKVQILHNYLVQDSDFTVSGNLCIWNVCKPGDDAGEGKSRDFPQKKEEEKEEEEEVEEKEEEKVEEEVVEEEEEEAHRIKPSPESLHNM